MHHLILASQSPRRSELLKKAGISFQIFPVKISENLRKDLNLDDQIMELAERKALASLATFKPLKKQRYLFLSADTLVILGQEILGKPENKNQAVDFLSNLSGQIHQVKTAVCLAEGLVEDDQSPKQTESMNLKVGKVVRFIETTKIHFRLISRQEIEDYVDTGDPMDKAGAYGIQGEAREFVNRIEGDLDNVIGLPIKKTLLSLQKEFQYSLGNLK